MATQQPGTKLTIIAGALRGRRCIHVADVLEETLDLRHINAPERQPDQLGPGPNRRDPEMRYTPNGLGVTSFSVASSASFGTKSSPIWTSSGLFALFDRARLIARY